MEVCLKEAIVKSPRSLDTGNTYQVCVLPDMVEVKELDLLPRFPSFFQNDNNAYQVDDVVWVLTDSEFQYGYVLGYAQPPAGTDIRSFVQRINEAEQEAGFNLSGYNELSVELKIKSQINFYNIRNNQSGVIFKTAVIS